MIIRIEVTNEKLSINGKRGTIQRPMSYGIRANLDGIGGVVILLHGEYRILADDE